MKGEERQVWAGGPTRLSSWLGVLVAGGVAEKRWQAMPEEAWRGWRGWRSVSAHLDVAGSFIVARTTDNISFSPGSIALDAPFRKKLYRGQQLKHENRSKNLPRAIVKTMAVGAEAGTFGGPAHRKDGVVSLEQKYSTTMVPTAVPTTPVQPSAPTEYFSSFAVAEASREKEVGYLESAQTTETSFSFGDRIGEFNVSTSPSLLYYEYGKVSTSSALAINGEVGVMRSQP